MTSLHIARLVTAHSARFPSSGGRAFVRRGDNGRMKVHASAVAFVLLAGTGLPSPFTATPRWPGCFVTYTYDNPDQPFYDGLEELHRASGITFVRVPTGGAVTVRDMPGYAPHANLFTNAQAFPTTGGYGYYTSGTVWLWWPYRQSGDKTRRNLITHEFGHILGFDHVEDEHDIMFFTVGSLAEVTPAFEQRVHARYPTCS